MPAVTDVLIIGGGVIGLTTACELARAGRRVVVSDKGALGAEASWAGAGIIPPGNPKRAVGPYERLRAVSSTIFAELSTWLQHVSGVDTSYRVCGAIEFACEEEGPPPLEAWSREGIAWEECDSTALQRLEPNLAPQPVRAFHVPGLAQVRNPRHLKALIAAATRLGVVLYPNHGVNGFSIRGRRVTAADAKGGAIFADHYVVCAGAWSRRLVGALRLALPLFPVRGQMLLLRMAAPPATHVLIQGCRYIVPRDDGRVLVGSTEDYVGFTKQTVAADLDDLRSFAVRLVPVLASAEVESSWAGLRPGTVDGLPYIGPIPGFENAWLAAGHFRAGIQLSPGTAKIITQLLTGEDPIVPVEAFRVDRPIRGPMRPAFRS
jgi:glycine oxidase